MKDEMRMMPSLVKLRFGFWSRRVWAHKDNLIILGYNKSEEHFFAFDRNRLRKVVFESSGWFENPTERAEIIFKKFSPKNFHRAVFTYEGTLFISKPAVSHRHFVTVMIDDVDELLKRELSYRVLDHRGDLARQISNHHVGVVKTIIESRQLV